MRCKIAERYENSPSISSLIKYEMSMSVMLEETYISVSFILDITVLLITKASLIEIGQQSNQRATPLIKV